MSAGTLLARIEQVKPTGRGRWRARCPVCTGRNATKLAIRERDDGVVLLHCFGCGANGPDVCDAIGLDPVELFPLGVDDRQRRPRERLPFSAIDALRLIAHEVDEAALLIAVTSKRQEQLTPERRARLLAHANSVRQALRACGLRELVR